MKASLTLFSPAKINLFLHVQRKRADGYHQLASLFQTVSFGDTLTFTLTETPLLLDPANLITRAIHLFEKKTGKKVLVDVRLEKRIPLRAGLGGGSSNAATTLWALNELYGKPATKKELALWSAEIGSDIPFFFSSGTAYVEGRGEVVESLEPLAPREKVWLLLPGGAGCSTPEIFGALKLPQTISFDPQKALEQWLVGKPTFHNSLEEPAFALTPSLEKIKVEIEGRGAMSGSGNSFFVLGDKPSFANVERIDFVSAPSEGWY